MHFVSKTSTPKFFIKNTEGKTSWAGFRGKRRLKDYILKNEQNHLCIYCEIRVSLNDSHCEHLKPKGIYPNLTFDYNNITISCEGNCGHHDKKHYSCGHVKDNYYNESLFLNPTKERDIADYFKFDLLTGKMLSSGKDDAKANYMINKLLKLNEPKLCIERLNSVRALLYVMKKFKEKTSEQKRALLNKLLASDDRQFCSFLKYKYNKYIK